MKLFELILSKGTLITTNKVVGSTIGYPYFRGEKGLALKGDSTNSIAWTQVITGVKTILFAIRKGEDTKLIYDNVTEKLEITGGNVSGTGLTQCYVDGVDTDVIGNNDYYLVIAEFSAGIDFTTNVTIAPSKLSYLAHKIVFYDSLLNASQRATELDFFIHSSPKISCKYPKQLPEMKPTDLSSEVDSVVVNLMDAGKGTFNIGTESWVAEGTNVIENDNGALKITYVDDSDGAITYFNAGADIDTNLTVNKSYTIHIKAKKTGAPRLRISDGTNNYYHVLTDNYEWYSTIFVAQHVVNGFLRGNIMGVGTIIWIDEWYIEEYFGLAASYNFINTGGLYVDTSGNSHSITINKSIITLAGAKLKAVETIGNLGNIKTIAFRIKPDSTSEKLMEGEAAGKYIYIDTGTLNYASFDKGYVNSVETDVVVADKWQDIVITSSTNVDFSACSLALNNTTTGSFEISDLRFYTDEKDSQWIINRNNECGKKIVLTDDLRWDAVGSVLPSGIRIESGTFSVAEDSTGKYILCGTNGSISYAGINLSSNIGNGWVKKLTGDLSGDEGGTVDAAANLSYASGKLTIAMTSAQKLRDIYITRGEEL